MPCFVLFGDHIASRVVDVELVGAVHFVIHAVSEGVGFDAELGLASAGLCAAFLLIVINGLVVKAVFRFCVMGFGSISLVSYVKFVLFCSMVDGIALIIDVSLRIQLVDHHAVVSAVFAFTILLVACIHRVKLRF